jgi:hypothetical protein
MTTELFFETGNGHGRPKFNALEDIFRPDARSRELKIEDAFLRFAKKLRYLRKVGSTVYHLTAIQFLFKINVARKTECLDKL